jgi:predicted PurR-regulated permease PerM
VPHTEPPASPDDRSTEPPASPDDRSTEPPASPDDRSTEPPAGVSVDVADGLARTGTTGLRIHPAVVVAGGYAWRLIAIGVVGWAVLKLMSALWVLGMAAAISLLLGRALDPVARALHRQGWRPALVAATTLLGFLMIMAAVMAVLVPAIVDEFSDLGPTIEDAVDDLEDWLVEDSPFDVSRQDIEDFREEARDRASNSLESQGGAVVSGTLVAFEVITGLVLSLIATFFLLKDGARLCRWILSLLPEERRPLASRLAGRAWRTLGGYLRGSATLGVIEGIIIGLTVWLVGGSLAVPIAVITFFAAFLPFAGAVLAGTVAVLVTLVTAGPGDALIVLVVAVLVQQFDNDLLAPIVFGKNLQLHPLIVLGAIVAGSTLFGPLGVVLAVPLTAVVINVLAEWRAHETEASSDDDSGGDSSDDSDDDADLAPADSPRET